MERLEVYYHASSIKGIKTLQPRISNHEIPLIYKTQIPDVVTCSMPVMTSNVEFIPDAYTAILEAERSGLISITRYGEMTEKTREWIKKTVNHEYINAEKHPEYRHFLLGNFPDLLKGCQI